MKEILYNLALIDALTFCKQNGIDPTGTYLYKYPRRFTYALLKYRTGKAIITTTFYKNRVPEHIIHTV